MLTPFLLHALCRRTAGAAIVAALAEEQLHTVRVPQLAGMSLAVGHPCHCVHCLNGIVCTVPDWDAFPAGKGAGGCGEPEPEGVGGHCRAH